MSKLVKEFAEKLDGREYLNEITPAEETWAKDNGLVVVYGYSDDNVEFSGAIYDEVPAWEGATIVLNQNGVIGEPDCGDYDCKYYQDAKKGAHTIHAYWGKGDYPWSFETDIPHEKFHIVEDGEPFLQLKTSKYKKLLTGLLFLYRNVKKCIKAQ